jgi:hypothetical protein
MVFLPQSWMAELSVGKPVFGLRSKNTVNNLSDPPDTVPLHEFMLEDKHGRYATKESRNPFTCGLSGKTYTAGEVAQRVEYLAQALAKEFGWSPNNGTEWDKVIGVFALNTVWVTQDIDLTSHEVLILSGGYHDFGLCHVPTFWHFITRKRCLFCSRARIPAQKLKGQGIVRCMSLAFGNLIICN